MHLHSTGIKVAWDKTTLIFIHWMSFAYLTLASSSNWQINISPILKTWNKRFQINSRLFSLVCSKFILKFKTSNILNKWFLLRKTEWISHKAVHVYSLLFRAVISKWCLWWTFLCIQSSDWNTAVAIRLGSCQLIWGCLDLSGKCAHKPSKGAPSPFRCLASCITPLLSWTDILVQVPAIIQRKI